jgi:D-glycero-D-manno-heptose 1,7-bisphosphate phosphatase
MKRSCSISGPTVFEFINAPVISLYKSIVIFDRDDTLIRDIPSLSKPQDIKWLPGVKETLRLLNQNQVACLIASNQRAVAAGTLTLDDLYLVSREMHKQSLEFGAQLSTFAYCIHEVRKADETIIYTCKCRKPQPGLINHLISLYHLPDIPIYFIGDKDTDRIAALNASKKIVFVPVYSDKDPLATLRQEFFNSDGGK